MWVGCLRLWSSSEDSRVSTEHKRSSWVVDVVRQHICMCALVKRSYHGKQRSAEFKNEILIHLWLSLAHYHVHGIGDPKRTSLDRGEGCLKRSRVSISTSQVHVLLESIMGI